MHREIEVHILSGEGAGKSVRFTPPFDIAVGRHETCQVQLADQGVSRVHCRLIASSCEVRVHDPGSRAGTLLNGARVQLARVHDGDVLDLGPARVRVAVLASGGPADSGDASWGDDEAGVRAEFVFCERCGRALSDATLTFEDVRQFGHHFVCQACIAETRRTGREIGGFRIIAELGKGNYATVYKAMNEEKGILAALKVLSLSKLPSASSRRRFEREASLLTALDHPGIVRLHAWGIQGDEAYLALELVDGSDMERRVREGGRLDPARAARVVRQMALALAYAHALGVIHRDVKPANVLQATDGAVKLADFGVAKSLGASAIRALTGTGMVIGTPFYMPLEQFRDSKRVTPRSDIYAAGATLYHLVGGQPPFTGVKTAGELHQLKRAGPPPLPLRELAPGAPAGLVRILERAMAAEPDARFASAEELAAALTPFAGPRSPRDNGLDQRQVRRGRTER